MSELSKQALKVDNNQSFPNNNNGAITPSILRAFNVNMIDSNVNQTDFDTFSGSVANEFASLTASVDPSITGSSLITASISGQTMTFTKGDGTTFGLLIPDVSGSTLPSGLLSSSVTNFVDYSASVDARILAITGSTINTASFATTGSNTFTGAQIVNADLTISSSQLLRFGAIGSIRDAGNSITVFDTSGGYQHRNFTTGELQIEQNSPSGLFIKSRAGGAIEVSGSQTFIQDVSFIPFSASVDTRINNIVSGTGFATTGSNSFNGNQNITGSVQISSQLIFGTSSLGPTIQTLSGNGLQVTAGESGSFSMRTLYGGGVANANIEAYDTFPTFNTGGKVSTKSGGGVDIVGYGGQVAITGSSLVMQGFTYPTTDGTNGQVLTTDGNKVLSFTTVSGGGINTGSFATTGSNVFTGDQTLIDAAGNTVTLSDVSGSLMLVAKTFTSASSHFTASANNQVNIIFKNNNNTADTIISGSNNIFINPAAPQAGFKRYIGNANIFLGQLLPSVSASMQYSPAINGNIGGVITVRGPVSASLTQISNNISANGSINIGSNVVLHAQGLVGTTTVNNNIYAGAISLVANQSNIQSLTQVIQNNVNGIAQLNLSSSAVFFQQNTINDGAFSFTNQYSSGSLGFGIVNIQNNTIGGSTNQFIITGSQPLGTTALPFINQNIVVGNTNTVFINSSESRVNGTIIYNQAVATGLIGNRLVVTGSSNINSDVSSYGSAFVGRYNAVDGVRDKTSDIVFAVGTGNSTTRKTGFHIDSGSNSFFEGAVSISGSLLLNGSSVGGIATGSFATTGSNSFFGNQIISGNIGIRGNTTFTSFSGDQSSVILGTDALGSAPGGSINVAIGNNAMKFASGSSQNVAIGNRALFKTTGSFNIAIGSETMTENTTGNNNVAIGLNALNVNTTGNDNFALGTNSMIFTSGSSANSNVAIGTDTLTRNQVDSQIAIGANALQRVTTGNANTAIGRLAMALTTTGYDNVAIGTNAMYENVDGFRNISIGKESMRRNTNGNRNIAIGYSALYENTTGVQNVAIGPNAMINNTTGQNNFALGVNSLGDNTTGNLNVAIGGESGQNASGSSNIFIGGQSGKFVTGSANTIIGAFTGTAGTTINNNIILADGVGVTRARYDTGTWSFNNPINVTGSLTIQSGSGDLFVHGNKQFNVGAFQSNVTQSGSANVSQSMNFETTDISQGVTIASNSRITLANSGTYNIQFSAQILADTGADDVWIWLKKNGTNVPASAGHVVLANNEELIASWNYVVNAVANDYYELAWQSANGDAVLLTEVATGNIPEVPSVILTVTQVR